MQRTQIRVLKQRYQIGLGGFLEKYDYFRSKSSKRTHLKCQNCSRLKPKISFEISSDFANKPLKRQLKKSSRSGLPFGAIIQWIFDIYGSVLMPLCPDDYDAVSSPSPLEALRKKNRISSWKRNEEKETCFLTRRLLSHLFSRRFTASNLTHRLSTQNRLAHELE